jgi:hypothetical protein
LVGWGDGCTGRQLLTGSFHPVSDDNWDHSVSTRPMLARWRDTNQAKIPFENVKALKSTSEAFEVFQSTNRAIHNPSFDDTNMMYINPYGYSDVVHYWHHLV